MTTIAVSQETKEFLTELKKAVKKVTGKKITYDEAVLVLIDGFRMLTDEKDSFREKVYQKALTLSEILSCPAPDKNDLEKYFYFVPTDLSEEVKKLSAKFKLPPALMLIKVLRDGLKTYESLNYQLPEELSREFVKWWGTLPKEKQEEVINLLDKKLTACFRGEFLKLKKKFKER